MFHLKSFAPGIGTTVIWVPLEPTLAIVNDNTIHKLNPGLEDLADFVSTLNSVQRLEALPFHKIGEYTREPLGYDTKSKN
ncbi:hypothetical protein IQ268_15755 [Oculatella sp. LEGE 06141]|uniref:hypothetical protein n=1 Tax=Oculatella sp. LEGE 06141 TaxID=1828648 RepID=UPI001880F3FD|nr:hypothetical protein [Oculatella sp. LEGE 06141]MBE9180025.1 hypothetical protein [Oculatella sp. LEGE 06141]